MLSSLATILKGLSKAGAVWTLVALIAGAASSQGPLTTEPPTTEPLTASEADQAHREVVDQPPIEDLGPRRLSVPAAVAFGRFNSVQVNVDGSGLNILGDAANEPSLAVDPTNSQRLVIGWRQFDSVASNFRQAGIGRSDDAGLTWTASVLDPGVFRSDPVLSYDHQGIFYYYSLQFNLTCDTFRSTNGGQNWGGPVSSFGGDKAWMSVDRGGGASNGYLYTAWTPGAGCCGNDRFTRSADGSLSFATPVPVLEQPIWGTTDVAPNGDVLVIGSRNGDDAVIVARSTDADDIGQPLAFDFAVTVDLGGRQISHTGPNPAGLLGQLWIGSNHAPGSRNGELYALGSLDPPGADPLDLFFSRNSDGGFVWGAPQRLNTDGLGNWQWFGTLGVAPNGRIDVVWADNRFDPEGFDSVLFYRFSVDGGHNWSSEIQITPSFDPHLGWPQQNKLGDYYDIVSFDEAAHLAYAATFNGEQDVYYLRIPQSGYVFLDGFESGDLDAWSANSND